MHSKMNVSKKVKAIYNLERSEQYLREERVELTDKKEQNSELNTILPSVAPILFLFFLFFLKFPSIIAYTTKGLFSCTPKCQIFQDSPSHRIFRRMHETLNIDKKIKLIT
jgi:hypothetical protein